jgi:hypothetical protein
MTGATLSTIAMASAGLAAVFFLFGGRALLPVRAALPERRDDDVSSLSRALVRLQRVLLGVLPSYFGVVFMFSAVLFEQSSTSSIRWLISATTYAGCVGVPFAVVTLARTRDLRAGVPLWLVVLGGAYCQFMLIVASAAAALLRGLSGRG